MAFVRWEEEAISSDKGRRVVHYFLRDSQGRRVLAVVGKEKSVRHMSYSLTSQFSALMAANLDPSSCSPSSALDFAAGGGVGCMKWKSRRELVDWLSSLVSDKIPCASLPMINRLDNEDAEPIGIQTSKGLSSATMGHLSKEFSWLGSAWDCRKKRKHYRSFRRNGITISVHDFVYVLAEDYKRLVAYVEDLYEDMRANRMVVVQWFHKVDEVGVVLPSDICDREIFFSRCLQDLSIECIDGLAAVLSVQDFDKFQNEARHKFSSWEPYMCRRQIDNDDVKPFDITQVQGYWSQELLRLMYATPGTSLKLRLKITHGGSKGNPNREARGGSKEKSRLNDGDNSTPGAAMDKNKSRSANVTGSRGEKHVRIALTPPLLRKELLKQKLQQQHQHLVPGCHVEVLSQDSGVRGCWFRCVVLKRHHDKVKVRYEDVQDADDTGTLEEWVLSSRVAIPDKLGIRSCGRPVVRPDPSQCSTNSQILDVGSIVDAWWHDGWWEGIVVSKELEGKLRVYFPGEHQISIFGLGDLRHSQDWVSNAWNELADRPDMASSLLSDIERENRLGLSRDKEASPFQSSRMFVEAETQEGGLNAVSKPMTTPDTGKRAASKHMSTPCMDKKSQAPNLSDVCHLIDNLKWSSSRKRRRTSEWGKGRSGTKRRGSSGSSSSSGGTQEETEEAVSNACSDFLLPVVDNSDNCKIGGSDPMLVTPMALCSSLVMSQ